MAQTGTESDRQEDEGLPLSEKQKREAAQAAGFLETVGMDVPGAEGAIDTPNEYRALKDTLKASPQTIRNQAKNILSNPVAANLSDLFAIRAALGLYDPVKYNPDAPLPKPGGLGEMTQSTLSMLGDFMKSASGGERTGIPSIDAHAAPPLGSDEYRTYFMNNVVLARADYDIHARKVWEKMHENKELSAGEAIEDYLHEYAALYKETSRGATFTDQQRAEMREPLIRQVAKLQEVDRAITNIRPTPEMLADNFVRARVLPEIGAQPREAWDLMQKKGLSAQEAMEQVLPGAENESLRRDMLKEVDAAQNIYKAVIAYESMTLTEGDALKALRESWEKNGVSPDDADRYAQMTQEKIAHYQTAEGGSLDLQTALGRAAVDTRAQMDRDRGVPERAIIDENNTFYQHEIRTMGEWLRDRAYFARDGGVPESAAERYKMEGKFPDNASTLDFYTSMYGGPYRIHRRANMEQAMQAAYQNAAGPETPRAEKQTQAPAAPQSAENKEAAAAKSSEIDQKQKELSQSFLDQNGATLAPRKDMLASAGINIESADTLSASLKSAPAQNSLVSLVGFLADNGIISAQTKAGIMGFLESFNLLEMERPQTPGTENAAFPASDAQKAAMTAAAEKIEAEQTILTEDFVSKNGEFLQKQKDLLSSAGINIDSPKSFLESMKNMPAQKSFAALVAFKAESGIISQEEKRNVDTFLNQFNDLESKQNVARHVPPRMPPGPDAPSVPLNDGAAFHTNNPFRMTLPEAALKDESQIARQSITIGNAIAASGEKGIVTPAQAVYAWHTLHEEDFTRPLTNEETRKASDLAAQTGLALQSPLPANDPKLLQIVSAYANDMKVAALPEEWTQAFTEVSAQIRTPGIPAAPAAEPVRKPEPGTTLSL